MEELYFMKDEISCDPGLLQEQFIHFVDWESYDAAYIIGKFLLSLADETTDSIEIVPDEIKLTPFFHAVNAFLFAKVIEAREEYRRAIHYYNRTLDYYSKTKMEDINKLQISARLRIAKCLLRLERSATDNVSHALLSQAIDVLEVTPMADRTCDVYLFLGKLYRMEGLHVKAYNAYAAALRLNPYAIDATIALTELTQANEIAKASTTAATSTMLEISTTNKLERQSKEKLLSLTPVSWIKLLIAIHYEIGKGNYQSALSGIHNLLRLFPCNMYCLGQEAIALHGLSQFMKLSHIVKKLRNIDPHAMEVMDLYGYNLREKKSKMGLNSLLHELMPINDQHEVVWLVASYHAESNGDIDNALQYVKQAISRNKRYAAAHFFHGILQVKNHVDPNTAISTFTTANKLHRTAETYERMIEIHMEMYANLDKRHLYKDAVVTARQLALAFPYDPHSSVVLASVLAVRTEYQDLARAAYQKALYLDPRNVPAELGLVNLHIQKEELEEATVRLQKLVDLDVGEVVITKLAEILVMRNQYMEALTLYHRALSLEPSSSNALAGLERLEKLMSGEIKTDEEVEETKDIEMSITRTLSYNGDSEEDETIQLHRSYDMDVEAEEKTEDHGLSQ